MDHHYYATAFATYRQYATEKDEALEVLRGLLKKCDYPSVGCKALSIGTGTGDCDFSFIEELFPETDSVEVHCIERNALYASWLPKKALGFPRLAPVVVVDDAFEALDMSAQQFDLVLAAHSIYYFLDKNAFLEQARACMAPNARLAIMINDALGLGDIYKFFVEEIQQEGTLPLYLADDLVRDLSDSGFDTSVDHVSSRVEVTDILAGNATGDAILSLFINDDARHLESSAREALVSYIAGRSFEEEDRHFIAHNAKLVLARV